MLISLEKRVRRNTLNKILNLNIQGHMKPKKHGNKSIYKKAKMKQTNVIPTGNSETKMKNTGTNTVDLN